MKVFLLLLGFSAVTSVIITALLWPILWICGVFRVPSCFQPNKRSKSGSLISIARCNMTQFETLVPTISASGLIRDISLLDKAAAGSLLTLILFSNSANGTSQGHMVEKGAAGSLPTLILPPGAARVAAPLPDMQVQRIERIA